MCYKGLVTNYGYKTGGGGAREILPLQKGGQGRKSFSHAEGGGGGHNKFWGSFSHIVGGHKEFPLFKMGGAKSFIPCLEGGDAKSFGPALFPLCSTPPPPHS